MGGRAARFGTTNHTNGPARDAQAEIMDFVFFHPVRHPGRAQREPGPAVARQDDIQRGAGAAGPGSAPLRGLSGVTVGR